MPEPISDLTSPITTAGPPLGTTPARQFTEPLRELGAIALLAGNAVFLALGFSGLFFVIDRWATDFGLRCAAVFGTFAGPLSIGLPLAAMLLATHVAPMVRRTRPILMTVCVELGVSAFFGFITFLGAFANDLSSARATAEGLARRSVWLGFLVLACIVVVRVWMGLYPAPKPRPAGYLPYAQPTYGRPYPGQPMYPQPTYRPGIAEPDYARAVAETTPETGWPVVPPPPTPAPLVVPTAEPTMHIPPFTVEMGGDATQKVPLPSEPGDPPLPSEAADVPLPFEPGDVPQPSEAGDARLPSEPGDAPLPDAPPQEEEPGTQQVKR